VEKIMKKAMSWLSAFACVATFTVVARAADAKSEHKTITNP
jgi:hypothetical protein